MSIVLTIWFAFIACVVVLGFLGVKKRKDELKRYK